MALIAAVSASSNATVRQAAHYDGALAQVTRVLTRIQPAATPRSAARFIKIMIMGVAVRQ
jgi:hypothetical protein